MPKVRNAFAAARDLRARRVNAGRKVGEQTRAGYDAGRPPAIPALDALIDRAAEEFPEGPTGPEQDQAEWDARAREEWNGYAYPPFEGPGYTEPPADWEGWHQPHSEYEREHYWDTPEHDIPAEPEPAGYEPIPEAEPF